MSQHKPDKDAARTDSFTAFDGDTPQQARARRPLPDDPKTPDQLHAWLKDVLDVHVPRKPVIEGHAAPFDYLLFTFFEGQPPAPTSPADPLLAGTIPPTDCVLWANRGGGKTFL